MTVIGIDIGGTMIKAGVVDLDGNILHKMEVRTPYESYEALLDVLMQIVKWSKERETITGLALSLPCASDPKTGESLNEGALRYIIGKNPAKDLGVHFNLPYAAENDGNCAALAEVWLGSAKELQDVVCVVCGTGIGGGVVKDRQIHYGSKRFAGEMGMSITGFDPVTNKPVPWSKSGSTLALVKDYASRMGVNHDKLDGKMVFERADQGDLTAKECLKRFYDIFAIGLHNIQHIYDPERILIGGGISARVDLLEGIEKALDDFYQDFDLVVSRPVVDRCTFQGDANLIGAVYHLTQSL